MESEHPYGEYSDEDAYQLLLTMHSTTGRSPSQFALELHSHLLFGRNIYQCIERQANQRRARQRKRRQRKSAIKEMIHSLGVEVGVRERQSEMGRMLVVEEAVQVS